MNSITTLVDSALKKFTGEEFPKLKEDISSNLEFRLIFTIDLSKPFKEAKKEFLKNYLNDLLTLSLGNISLAAKKAQVHRRHLHRIILELDIDPNTHRKELLKPSEYKRVNVYNILDETLAGSAVQEDKLKNIYSNLDDISEIIAENMDEIASYDEALDLFEKEYIQKALKENDYNIQKTAGFLDISERTLYRKISKLNIEVV
ncbi:hypothetical protein JXC34_02845 [Candidatus Woesearchaeota archaeon]|nr:hypothetical protein [Candidatus Woesearchaeota archaeon]